MDLFCWPYFPCGFLYWRVAYQFFGMQLLLARTSFACMGRNYWKIGFNALIFQPREVWLRCTCLQVSQGKVYHNAFACRPMRDYRQQCTHLLVDQGMVVGFGRVVIRGKVGRVHSAMPTAAEVNRRMIRKEVIYQNFLKCFSAPRRNLFSCILSHKNKTIKG